MQIVLVCFWYVGLNICSQYFKTFEIDICCLWGVSLSAHIKRAGVDFRHLLAKITALEKLVDTDGVNRAIKNFSKYVNSSGNLENCVSESFPNKAEFEEH